MEAVKPKYVEFFKAISYLLHPVAIPLIAVVFYFVINPHYFPEQMELVVVATVLILTYLIPIISIFLLANLGLISSVYLTSVADRKRPLIVLISMHSIVLFKVLNPANFYDLYFFFMAIITALTVTYIALFFNKKISLHLLAMGGLIGFLLVISILHQQNYLLLIALFVFLSGVVATSRLLFKAHTHSELIWGFVIGLLSQFIVFYLASFL